MEKDMRNRASEEEKIFIENVEELEDLEYTGEGEKPLFASVRVNKKDFSVYELYRKYQKGQLILEISFQRNEVWKGRQKYELIESIFMGLPLSVFYFKQQDNATYVVVDGTRRLSVLFDYLNNKFSLKSLKILKFLNGKKFKDLTGELGIYQSQLEDYQIYSHVILPPTPDKILFDIFDRVNRGGTLLNKQEIRNALYHGEGLDMIAEITKTEAFAGATGIEHSKDSRMQGAYLVTRFLSFYLLFHDYLKKEGKPYEYNGNLDDLIETTLTQLNHTSKKELDRLREMIIQCLIQTEAILGKGAFRRELNSSNPINMNLFEITLYVMSLIWEKNLSVDPQKAKSAFYDVITNQEFLEYIGNDREQTDKVYGRLRWAERFFEEICHD